jgi:hypothetical protein
MTTDQHSLPGRRRLLFVGTVMPLVIATAGAILGITWLPDLPDPVATHWGSEGADGYGSAWTLILIPLGITLIFTAATEFIGRSARIERGLTSNDKVLIVTRHFLSVLLTTGTIGSLAVQRGLTDATDAPDIAGPMLAGAAGGILLAVAVWFVLPRAVPAGFESQPEVEPLDLAPTERVYWARTVHISGAVVALIAVVVVLSVGVAIVASFSAQNGIPVVVWVTSFVVVVSIGMSFWRVRIDRRGLSVRGLLGVPRVTIPAAEIREVRVVDVNPTADFGGWGWRWAPGRRTGIIMRRGQAIEVSRRDGRRLVVTVDDAENAAAVLQTVRSRVAS